MAGGQKQRIASLDGLRGLALVAVLAYHVAPGWFRGGFLGVDVFFVLSGFLLTALLLGEHDLRGTIDRLGYAVRRVRRIAPALLVLLAALVVIVPVLARSDAHRLPGDVLSSLAGVTNWHLIGDGSSYFARAGRPSFVRHLWSIAVEIQFYVVCPFLVGWLARHKPRVAIATLVAGIAASATLMGVLYRSADPSRAYFGTDTRIHALLVGCLAAVVLHRARQRRSDNSSFWGPTGTPQGLFHRKNGVGLVPLAVVALLVLVGGERSRAMYPAGFLAVEVATAAMIFLALRPGLLTNLLARDDVRWLGKRSYGIYLWHWPLVVLVRPGTSADWPIVPAAVVTLAGAVVLGALSYRFVELPFLRPGRGAMHPSRRTAALHVALLTVAAASVGTALARVPTTDSLAEVLHAGEKVLATQPLPSTTAPAPATTTATTAPPTSGPAGTAAPRAARVRTAPVVARAPRPQAAPKPQLAPLPPGSMPVTAIGDSVMVAAAGELKKRLGPSGYIDAKQNRYFSEAAPILHQLRAQGALGRIVVIHLGNNGPVSPGDIDAAMREVPDVQNVLLVTVRVDKSWQNSVNQTLRDGAARWPQIQIVDWYAYSSGHGDWFQADGTHFRTSSGPGANAYADLIAGSIPPPPTTTTTAPPPPPTTAPPPPTTTSTTAVPLVP
jgi:peptidoglycan/LPS O-acetylase OafA/YrhL